MIDVFLSKPNWVPPRMENHFKSFYPLLSELGFNPRTIGDNVESISSPFETVVRLMGKCECTIVLGIPQLRVETGRLKEKELERGFSLPTEWNQIEAAISIMLDKPTLMMLHKGVSARGLFESGAANVFVHEFHTIGSGWVEKMRPKLEALKERVND